jgi:nucleoside-diphosphate-sugar epimerase
MERTGLHLLVFGLGYTGIAIAVEAAAAGAAVTGTSRDPSRLSVPPGVACVAFDEAERAIAAATHIVATAPAGESGDPVLGRYGSAIAAGPMLRWIGYLSTTGVYGDRGGGWVDEQTPPAPRSARTERRLQAEQAWSATADRRAIDLFRLAGIYGPGRSAFDGLRAGTARRIVKPGHRFGRIHRDDIARAVFAAMQQERVAGVRVLNLADDEPAETALVIEEAARLLGVEPPPMVPFAEAVVGMSPMARSFWAENRLVASRKTQAALGISWRYPSYREGLRAILVEERGESPA